MSRGIKNYTEKPITEFTDEDTLYLQKTHGGYTYAFLIKYISFSKGVVRGEILDIQPNSLTYVRFGKKNTYGIGDEISGRIGNCYLFEDMCRWFEKNEDGLYIAR